MNNIYQKAVSAVEEGANFRVDFPTRSLKLRGKFIIKNGEYAGKLGVQKCSEEEFFSKVEELYDRYKHSLPSERSESKARRYFMALPERELSDDAMLYGERRDKAQIELELFILCQLLGGFRWNTEKFGKWFWQSANDKDLIILRDWVEPINNN
ncbi:MAG: hypothetical protein NC250_09320 [Alistipes senegalensis]|nr:hypothetical protein [Bacteroides cellulosilyticus]MCM1352914.1 hypothetical protein [Alistipes senegalensis]